jgi:hypothetical protein
MAKRKNVRKLVKLAARISLQLVCLLLMVVCLPVYVYCLARKLVFWCYFKCTLGMTFEFMSGEDGFWGLEFVDLPENHVHVNALMFLSGVPDFPRIVDTWSDRLVEATDDEGRLKFRKLQQKIERRMGYVLWRDELDFQLQDHISVLTDDAGNVVRFRSDAHLRTLVTELTRKPFKRGTSPWRVTIIPEFTNDETQARYALYFKV